MAYMAALGIEIQLIKVNEYCCARYCEGLSQSAIKVKQIKKKRWRND